MEKRNIINPQKWQLLQRPDVRLTVAMLLQRYAGIPNTISGCIEWTGYVHPGGYGIICLFIDGQNHRFGVHRAAYEILVRTLNPHEAIDHLCRNRSCINIAHLEPVDPRTNNLRGNSVSARNAAKTHCFRGHEFIPGNFSKVRGFRICLICQRIRDTARRLKRKELEQ